MAGYPDLLAEYKKLAKRANQRLVRLERFQEEGSKEATRYAYAKAQASIEGFRGDQYRRWSETGKGYSADDLNLILTDIKTFLGSTTSTKSGFTEMNKAKVESLNKTLDTEFSAQQFTKFMETGGLFDKLLTQFGYREAFEAGSKIMQNLSERKKKLSKRQVIEALDQITLSGIDVKEEDAKAKIKKLMRAKGRLGESNKVTGKKKKH